MRTLLIEDDPSTRKSLEFMLGHANFNVYTTETGEEGIELSKLYDYDLILLDLRLPDMSGHDVLRKIRLSRIDTPALIVSGYDDAKTNCAALAMGQMITSPSHSTAKN